MFFTTTGQELTEHFRVLNSANGLASNAVNCVCKDHNGFLWIGTNNGLSRFDGKNVVNYFHQPNDSNSLVNNGVNSICEDDRGRIWLATEGGVSVLDVRANKFRNFTSIKNSDSVLNIRTFVPSVAYYEHRVYVGLRNGILSTPTDTIAFHVYSKKELHCTKNPRCLPARAFSTGNGLWFATASGLFYTKDGMNFMNKDNNPNHLAIFKELVFSFCNDGDSLAWFGTWDYEGVYRFRYKTAQLDSFPFKGLPSILTIARVGNEIWAGTFSRGVLTLDLKTGKQHYQEQRGSLSKALTDIRTDYLFVDEQGTVFSGTSLGLYYVNPVQAQFTSFSHEVDDKHAFPPSMPFDIEEDNTGTIWCGSFVDGLFSFDPKSRDIHYHKLDGDYNRVWTIYNAGNHLLLGSYAGLGSFDLKTKKHTPIKLPAALNDQTTFGIIFIEPISEDEYWIGLWQHGLLRFNIKTGAYRFFSAKDSVNKLPGKNPSAAASLNGHLWMGYLDGGIITKINNLTNEITNFKFDSDTKLYGGINSLIADRAGKLWTGTMQSGLVYFDDKGQIIKEYTTSEGLTGNRISFLQFDDHNRLWIGTSCGLNKLDVANKKITTFTYSDGLPSNQFTDKIILKHSNGNIYVVCDNYMVKFDPAKLVSNSILPKVHLLSIEKSGVPCIQKTENDDIYVSYDDRVVSVEFTAINYIDPDKTQFAYKLEGFDRDWNYSGKRDYLSFTSLPPGNYTLKIKATNKTDHWNVPEQLVILHVAGPFWKTWWFFALCLITTFLLAFSIYYIRLRQILKIQAIRDKISKDLHDEIGSALSSIAIYSEVAKKYSEEKAPEIISILNSLQETANAAMENMSDIVWSINPMNDRFSATVKRVEIFANELLNARGITTHFTVDQSIHEHKLNMQQRKNIYLICKEAINNVAKYSRAKNCTVEMNDNNSQITITIKDDGVGIEGGKETLGGNGIINMKKRAQELKGLLNIISEKNSGTLLSLRFII
jgi:ligand-binding sensor domain-containing protein